MCSTRFVIATESPSKDRRATPGSRRFTLPPRIGHYNSDRVFLAYNVIVGSEAALQIAVGKLNQVRQEIAKVIVGQQDVVDGVLICLLASGHVLLEGVPGLGKTTLLRTLARALHLKYSRIQFTPDLMPADIVGSMIIETDDRGSKALRFQPGPIFANLVLADEINRATPKTQSALLEAMQERTVTSGTTTHHLELPFLVMATQNPIEMEGTYPLPEAQLDRFLMKILVAYPNREELNRIVERTIQKNEPQVEPVLDRDAIHEVRTVCREVLVAPHVQEVAIQMVMATQPEQKEAHELARKYIRYGSSPRGAQALVECGRVLALMRGRYHLSIDDIQTVAAAVLRHRIILNFDAHADGQTPDSILTAIIKGVTKQASAA
jgi:MoxR-like ATPase